MNQLAKHKLFFPVLLCLGLTLDLLFYFYTLEDAQITYRYALRFSEGFEFGMWNRTDTPVEGFTTFLWMVYLSLFGPDLDSIVHASKLTGMLAHMGIVALFFTLYRHLESGKGLHIDLFDDNQAASNAFLYSAVAMAVFLPISFYATSGMEMLLFTALIVAIFLLPLLGGSLLMMSLIAMLLVLTRPDGILFAFAAPLYYWFVGKDKRYLVVMLATVATFMALSVFRYEYFGYLMPNTYYAKSANVEGLMHLKHGVLYFGSFIVYYGYLFIPFFLACVMIVKRKELLRKSFLPVSFAGIALYYAIVAKAGADNFSAFPMWRHGLNLFPLVLFGSFYSLYTLTRQKARLLSNGIIVLLIFMPLIITTPFGNKAFLREQVAEGAKRFPSLSHSYKDNALLIWLDGITDNNTVVTTLLAGALPLTVDAVHIDMLGLNNEHIAHNGKFDPRGPVDSKSEMGYVLEQKPDIIEGYISGIAVLNDQGIEQALNLRRRLLLNTFTNPLFKDYLFITNAPYDALDRALFIHKNYYNKVKVRYDIQVKPVDTLISIAQMVKGKL